MNERTASNQSVDTNSYYKELGLGQKATADEIRKAYKKKIAVLHPNKGGDPEKFKKVQEVYEVLSDPEKKAIYDQYGEEGLKEGGAGVDPFSAFFGRGQASNAKRKLRSKLVQHTIKLEEAYSGVKKELEFKRLTQCASCKGTGSDKPDEVSECPGCKGQGERIVIQKMGGMMFQTQQTCPECQGEGKIIKFKCKDCKGEKIVTSDHKLTIDIEKGTYDGFRKNFVEEGDQYPGIETGDVVVEILIEPHKTFIRKGADLIYKKDITLYEALTGVNFVITHLDGLKLLVTSRPGDVVKPGTFKTIHEKGMPFYDQSFKCGNLFIDFNIIFPDGFKDEEVNELLEKIFVNRINLDIPNNASSERYQMQDFKLEDENTHHSGGKAGARQTDEDDDYSGHGHEHHQTIPCQSQ